MPQIREVSIEYGRTINLGNYESERVHVVLTATVGEEETALRVVHDLGVLARDTVEAQLREAETRRRRAA